MSKERIQAVQIEGPAGQLEALFHQRADAEPRAAAVVCHPHPLYGGNMHNKVAHRLDKALFAAECALLRFNFRGVGASAGRHDDGYGEADDARAARDWMAARFPGTRLVMAGFSFGAARAMEAGWADERVVALVLAGAGEAAFEDRIAAEARAPVLLIHGTEDDTVPIEPARAWARDLQPPSELVEVSGADHFFGRQLEEIDAAVARFIPPILAG